MNFFFLPPFPSLLQLSFTREVEVIASTLQPASTIHTFTFNLPAPNTPLAPSPSGDLLRASVLTNTDNRSSAATFAYPYTDNPFARPSSAYLGPPSLLGHGSHAGAGVVGSNANDMNPSGGSTITYHGVCLTVWSHADAERSNAIRRTLEASRSRKESAQSLVASRLKNLRADIAGPSGETSDPTIQARRSTKKNARGPWVDGETDGGETEPDGGISESDFEVASTIGHGPGESTLFLPGDTVFWLPYALSKLNPLRRTMITQLTNLVLRKLSFRAILFTISCVTTSLFPGHAFQRTCSLIRCKYPRFLPILPLVLVTSSSSMPAPRSMAQTPTWR
jgi:nicotinamide N-methyltransferase